MGVEVDIKPFTFTTEKTIKQTNNNTTKGNDEDTNNNKTNISPIS